MNLSPDDDPLADLEARLRAWRPAELPTALRTRLLTAGPVRRPGSRARRATLSGVCALALGTALLLAGHVGRPPDTGADMAASSVARRAVPEKSAEPRWVLGESLTMHIDTGVAPGMVPAAWRLDGDFVSAAGLLPVRSTDGKLPLKVNCQF